MNKIDKFIANQIASTLPAYEIGYSSTQKIKEIMCDVDHQNSKNLNWDYNHCGVSYYSCPKCGNMFIFW